MNFKHQIHVSSVFLNINTIENPLVFVKYYSHLSVALGKSISAFFPPSCVFR